MDDKQIVELYWQRSEMAIQETAAKYGPYCRAVAAGILADPQDTDECLNDTWIGAWNAMPPHRPSRLRLFLGKITRSLACDTLRARLAQKRGGGMDALLSELDDCLPSSQNVAQEVEARELSARISAWLLSQKPEDRILFVRRYWYADSLKELAEARGAVPARLSERLYRMRLSLKTTMEKEGVIL